MRTLSLVLIIAAVTVVDAHASPLRSDTILSHRDSIRQHYLRNGAWRYSINSREYQREIDSGIALSHDDAYLWQQRGMPLFKQMKYELGMPYVDSAVKYDSDAWLDYRAFLKCIFQKDYRGALVDFEVAKRRHPSSTVMDHEYAFYMGLCHLQLDEFDRAESCFKHTIETDRALTGGNQNDGWVHYLHTFYLGVTQYVEGHYSDAIASLDQSLATYARFSDAKYYKALCLMKTGNDVDAHQLFTEAHDDLRDGITINEDNAIYERYPYQVRSSWIDAFLAKNETTIDTHRSQ